MSTSSWQHREAARVELRQVEHVADEPLEPPDSAAITSSESFAGLRILGEPFAERLDVAADRRQRRPQLVRDRHQEVPLELLRLGQPLGHLRGTIGEVGDLVRAP